ncbi:Protein of unknown function [Jatrophihabitans endophyticus]|uniref:DUF3515 domain-containing protein n=1 Tax=Jatrophihabitans endophyticus TaxID=1206085 RepID=A0A1M5D2V1_9ACTN|nr:DUF3515 domain-containing protein [Jatrophihabitans endophyticus]SHF61296.1 Protein of unknown function [Jatrophihabitans endophyticus]
MAIDPVVRRAALIATAVTLPLVVLLALTIGSVTGDSDPSPSPTANPRGALTFADPPRADVDAAACAKVLAQLPITLGRLSQRVVRTPKSPFVVAWGDPAVVLRCGVTRPASLKPGDASTFQNTGDLLGPYFDVVRDGDAHVWTSVDRAAYVSVTIPSAYQGADVMPPLGAAIAKALPAVCTTDSATADLATLCTRRK